MKKLLLLLLCVPLMFCCGEKKDHTQDIESEEILDNTKKDKNSSIEVEVSEYADIVSVRNISIDKKYEFTVSIYLKNCSYDSSDTITTEEQEIITLNPGEVYELGSSERYCPPLGKYHPNRCYYRIKNIDGLDHFEREWLIQNGRLDPDYDQTIMSSITYRVLGELEVK